eukprot:6466168-Amphidinium_carterae.1
MGRPLLHQDLSSDRAWHSIHVDNFDAGVILSETAALQQFGQPLASQVIVQDAYAQANLERDPNKSVEGTLGLRSLGAHVDGMSLLCQSVLQQEQVSEAAVRSCLGKLVHVLMFRRLVMAALDLVFPWCCGGEACGSRCGSPKE